MNHHQPVFKSFILSLLRKDDRVVLDATLGEGGHTEAFLEAEKKVIAFERDPYIMDRAKQRLSTYIDSGQLHIHHYNYSLINFEKIGEVDLALFDLGVSKFHYFEGGGFTFQKKEPLDMRLDRGQDGEDHPSAADIINQWNEVDLANLFYRYGEESLSRQCARLIGAVRDKEPILTTSRLAELITSVYRCKKVKSPIHPATKVFQALRIEVNQELEHITPGVNQAIDCLSVEGRLAVIAYHSLEDRLIKKIFRSRVTPRHNYNKYLPPTSIADDSTKTFILFNKKIIRPNQEEIESNPSARSACLRILVRSR